MLGSRLGGDAGSMRTSLPNSRLKLVPAKNKQRHETHSEPPRRKMRKGRAGLALCVLSLSHPVVPSPPLPPMTTTERG